ncbi:DUF3047 domain-containing protein [Limnobacter humi]|uniref:DUF3047 domain-containing protein n=1 Tax=Limnobacter humi TaxID=1778671 RepID=A0ABT1WHN8_9BURK|nr:DUF3047 domain-containing protein [Limnobacter humi]MCQ8897031.1 DUF3047 domain-containing protein [Limnobacter humi]
MQTLRYVGPYLVLMLGACSSVNAPLHPADETATALATERQAACAQLDVHPATTSIQLLNTEPAPVYGLPDDSPLKGWQHLTFFPFKLPTRFGLQQCASNGQRFLTVDAKSSASSLVYAMNKPVTNNSRLRWKWWVAEGNPKAQTRDRALEDSPVRVVLTFDGNRSNLSEADQAFLQRLEAFTRRPAPFATLMYSVAAGVEPMEIVTSQHTQTVRIKALQVRGEPQGEGQWWTFDRNIREDYIKAFGEAPGQLLNVAIMGDADNTQGSSRAYVADLQWVGD